MDQRNDPRRPPPLPHNATVAGPPPLRPGPVKRDANPDDFLVPIEDLRAWWHPHKSWLVTVASALCVAAMLVLVVAIFYRPVNVPETRQARPRPRVTPFPRAPNGETTGTFAVPRAGAARDWEELLRSVELPRDQLSGEWRRDAGGITAVAPHGQRDSGSVELRQLQLPAETPMNYDLEVSFTRRSGAHSVLVLFPVDVAWCYIDVNSWGSAVVSSAWRNAACDVSSSRRPFTLKNNQRYTTLIRVRVRGPLAWVDVAVDEAPYASWHGSPAAAAMLTGARGPGAPRLSLATEESVVTFHRVRLREIEM